MTTSLDTIRVRRSATATEAPYPRSGGVRRLSERMRRTASSRAGLVVLYLWALAEALVWPLVPDSALMGMTFAAPRAWPRLVAAAVAGTVSGGTLGVLAGRAGAAWPLPLVTGRMEAAASGWVTTDGAAGLWHQPLSGVPYKAFVRAFVAGDEPLTEIAWLTVQARGARMLLTALVGAAAGAILWRVLPERHRSRLHVGTVAVATPLLFAGLATVVAHWS